MKKTKPIKKTIRSRCGAKPPICREPFLDCFGRLTTCDMPAGHAGEHSWGAALLQREQPAPLTQKLVLHLESGDVELGEVEAKALREYLNCIYLTHGFCGEPYVISGETLADQNAFHISPRTVTVTGLDGKSFTLTNAVITHHFYPGKKP